MDRDRYGRIDRDGAPLSQGEMEEGWHFCPEWDGMLVGPLMPEWEYCKCERPTKN